MQWNCHRLMSPKLPLVFIFFVILIYPNFARWIFFCQNLNRPNPICRESSETDVYSFFRNCDRWQKSEIVICNIFQKETLFILELTAEFFAARRLSTAVRNNLFGNVFSGFVPFVGTLKDQTSKCICCLENCIQVNCRYFVMFFWSIIF